MFLKTLSKKYHCAKTGRAKINRGFTLVETLVYLGIFGILLGVVITFQSDIFFFNSVTQTNLVAQMEGRRVVRSLVTELRESSPSSLGAYSIAEAATSSVTFFSNIDGDALKERVRYYLQNKTFYKGVIKPFGNPLSYNPASEVITTLITNVVNASSTPVFEYFDTNYAGSGAPLALPINIPSVRLVKVNVIIEADPNRAPTPLSVTSQVTIRNLKDNL